MILGITSLVWPNIMDFVVNVTNLESIMNLKGQETFTEHFIISG